MTGAAAFVLAVFWICFSVFLSWVAYLASKD
jgi:hypothetical protein